MKEILVGDSSFENIIKGGYLYVDKTEYLYNLLDGGGTYYFLSRPHGFGKRLFLNTLEQVFKGKRELFKGLYIDSTDYDWKEYPVIHIDFNKCPCNSVKDINTWINTQILNIASSYSIELKEKDGYDINLDELIDRLSVRGKVAVLIDDYDAILINNINNKELESIRKSVMGFYSILKSECDNIRLCFITGVTRFAVPSIFSMMNNLNHISMDKPYALAFGFTQNEVETYFDEYIENGRKALGLTRKEYLEKLKDKYDGYRFSPYSDEAVYNPVSISSFFLNGGAIYDNYWIKSDDMNLLMTMAERVRFNIAQDLENSFYKERISSFDIVEMATGNVTPLKYRLLLLQSGYLTIKKAEREGRELYLGFPNEEVEEAFSLKLLGVYGGEEAEENFNYDDLLDQFKDGNTQGIIDNLFSVYASIPYREEQKQIEADYQGMFYAMMIVIHARVNLEVVTNKGRIDAVVETNKHVYVIEFKRDETADKALEQIKDKGYYEKYKAWSNNNSRTLHLLGINFSTEKRNITEWKEEILTSCY